MYPSSILTPQKLSSIGFDLSTKNVRINESANIPIRLLRCSVGFIAHDSTIKIPGLAKSVLLFLKNFREMALCFCSDESNWVITIITRTKFAPPPGLEKKVHLRKKHAYLYSTPGVAQCFQKPLNRSGNSSVYRTVCSIERCPR